MKEKIWKIREGDDIKVATIRSEMALSPIIARLLVNRGIDTKEAVYDYYNATTESFHDPFMMTDMKMAVKRILRSRDQEEKIMIYGDYDVDGVTSTSILYMFLEEIGCLVDYYIPDRHEEGYGINIEALTEVKDRGFKLLISVDTGITAVKEVAYSNEIGLDVIITDHHECQDVLPSGVAVLNPKREGDRYPFKMLAGVGVTFKLIQALARTTDVENKIWKYLDLVAVGTIADIVPIYGENRTITKLAFQSMPTTWNKGLEALMKVSDLEGKKMTAGRIGFGIGPRLNAAGRIKHAKEAVELFILNDTSKCMTIAEGLDQDNKNRQSLEKRIFEEAVALIEASSNPPNQKVIVVASDSWHHGVIGIVASKLVEKYYRPIIILTIKDGVASGSARSVEGFNLYLALKANGHLFDKFGGHEMAAGMSLQENNIEALEKGLNLYADEHMEKDVLIPKLKVDMVMKLEDIGLELIEDIQKMEPFGMGNPEPTFICEGPIHHMKKIGKDQTHLSLELGVDPKIRGVGFSLGEVTEWIDDGQLVQCVCSLEINEWNQRKSPQMMVKDIRHTTATLKEIKNQILEHSVIDYFEDFEVHHEDRLSRQMLSDFYRFLMQKDSVLDHEIYFTKLMAQLDIKQTQDLKKYLMMLEVFSELELIQYEIKGLSMTFSLNKGKKVDLQDSKLYNKFL
ncbi:Single-stranded-DNA-specific exonuclease RecJ [Petrocella atlantisensis]|uniref:Single-stranded-DNA-specific exonuclease RecJ n=1 Tax=Petrocella atlantisensis TaxID=2173034 RepID=A0A3P7PJ07_9FIRM|nr:single-stranded-DNA-specific exonuclease RecJ [Petrocella atlantisensis]VDN48928.1 Single-stranded-DNA-specific exonuclease RecJ [Petrocella atlantisensis]